MGTHHRNIDDLERQRLHGPKQPMEQDRVQHRAQDVLRLQPVEDLSARASANLSSSLSLFLSVSLFHFHYPCMESGSDLNP